MQMLFLSSYVCYIIEINTSVMKNCQLATYNLVVIEKQEAHSNFKDLSFFLYRIELFIAICFFLKIELIYL